MNILYEYIHILVNLMDLLNMPAQIDDFIEMNSLLLKCSIKCECALFAAIQMVAIPLKFNCSFTSPANATDCVWIGEMIQWIFFFERHFNAVVIDYHRSFWCCLADDNHQMCDNCELIKKKKHNIYYLKPYRSVSFFGLSIDVSEMVFDLSDKEITDACSIPHKNICVSFFCVSFCQR